MSIDPKQTQTTAHTPGPWEPGHLCDDTTKCNCPYIFDGGYAGGIGEVYIDNGKGLIAEGANDCPPRAEAVANLRLICAAPDLLAACEGVLARCCGEYPDHPETLAVMAAISRAKGSVS
jgi:hypothetical protein